MINLQEKQKEIREFLEWYQKSSHRPLRELTMYCLEHAVEAKTEDEYLAIINKMRRDEIALLEIYYKLPLEE